MRQPTFTLAALQATPTPWDKQGNFEKLERLARQAVAGGAEVVVTSEGFLEGYLWNDDLPKDFSRERYFEVGEAIDGPLMRRAGDLARELAIYLVLGFAERRGDCMYNSVAIYSPQGDLALRYSKTHTAFDEPFNTKGVEFPVLTTPFGRWGSVICMDRQLPETARILAIKGAQLILVPAWGMSGEMNDVMMRTRAYENGVHIAFVHPRRCLIIDPSGNIIAEGSGAGEEIVTARLELCPCGSYGTLRHRRPEIYGELLEAPDSDS
jgi:predicted amidohydrolase